MSLCKKLPLHGRKDGEDWDGEKKTESSLPDAQVKHKDSTNWTMESDAVGKT